MTDSLRRQWLMLSLLPRAPRKIDTASMEERLRERGVAVNRRSIQRDLLALSESFPILRDLRSKPYGWSFSDTEPHALGPLAGLSSRPGGVGAGEAEARIVSVVHAALLDGARLSVSYRPRVAAEMAIIELTPRSLVYRDGAAFLVGTTAESELLELTLSCVASARCLWRRASPRAGAKDHDDGGRPAPAFVLKVLIDRRAAVEAHERPVGREQELTRHDTKRMMLRAMVTDSESLRRWLLGLGADLDVLEPATLRADLARIALALVRRHGERR